MGRHRGGRGAVSPEKGGPGVGLQGKGGAGWGGGGGAGVLAVSRLQAGEALWDPQRGPQVRPPRAGRD